MTEHKDEKWLDKRLQRAVDGSTPVFDARAWKQKYANEYDALQSRGRNVARSVPHATRILRSPLGRAAIAAAIVVVASILLIGQFRPTVRKPVTEPEPAPARMVSMISLSAAFRSGGMEGLDKQCERALERLGPRPASVSMQELLKDLSSKEQEGTSI
jgi:hypothetical protein